MVSVERPVGVEAGHLEVICSVTFGCAGPSGCGGRGSSLAVVRGLLIVATSPVGEHRLSSASSVILTQAQLLCGMWNLPGAGVRACPLHWQQILTH